MSITLYHASVPVFSQMLTSLSGLLGKAEAFAAARKIDGAVLLGSRLAPDMFPLTRQVQVAADFAKGASARLAGVEVPKYADDEATIAELKGRIDKTLAFIGGLDRAAIAAADDRDVTITLRGAPLTFKGRPYLLHFALPNFYFHHAMAYAILRENGVDLGKGDYMGAPPTM